MFNKLLTSFHLSFGAVASAETNNLNHLIITLSVALLAEYLRHLRSKNDNNNNNNLKTE